MQNGFIIISHTIITPELTPGQIRDRQEHQAAVAHHGGHPLGTPSGSPTVGTPPRFKGQYVEIDGRHYRPNYVR